MQKIILEDGEPCDHPGCKNHISHPCERCGRIGAKGRAVIIHFGYQPNIKLNSKPPQGGSGVVKEE